MLYYRADDGSIPSVTGVTCMLMSCNVQSWLSLLYTVAILLVQDGSVVILLAY